jgi:AcrR family transcriptional regulator
MPNKNPLRFQRARRPDQIEQRREAILHAALVLFQEKGLENVTLADVAAKAGTAKSNLYRYFDNREHIYLRVLQRLGADWEKRALPPLQKLNRNGTPAKVARILTEAFLQAHEYSTLISVINPVLEKSLTPDLVADFRSGFLERRRRLAIVLAAALPKRTFENVYPLTIHIFTHVAGLWPLCHGAPGSTQPLEKPEFAHLNYDFRTEMTRFLTRFLG